RRCPHGRDISCPTRHHETDPRLGQPMCPDCYDYETAVLFNAYAADLWRRFVTYLPRRLAWLAGVTQKTLHDQLRLRFVKVADYLAKYATKTLTAPGLPSCRLRGDADIERLRCSAHYRRLITTAWQLGTRFRAWAHMLGYGGHFLTKSRRYSVTFGQLRAAR